MSKGNYANKRAPRFKARGYFQKFITSSKKSLNPFKARVVKNPTSNARDPNDGRVKTEF